MVRVLRFWGKFAITLIWLNSTLILRGSSINKVGTLIFKLIFNLLCVASLESNHKWGVSSNFKFWLVHGIGLIFLHSFS
ncbi:hypothetical protein LguiA_011502 [Lonicera macranthoides]